MTEPAENPLRALARIAADVGPALAPAGQNELLGSIMEAARRLFDAAACSLALLDETGAELVFHVASGRGAEDVVGLRIPSSRGIAGWVVMSGQPIAVDDVRADSRFASDAAESTGYVPTSILAMPLETERRMLGVIEVLDRGTGRGGGADDMELLALFARQAALAIESSRVFTDLGRVLLEALGHAVDAGSDIHAEIQRLADSAPGPDPGLRELTALLADLGRRGEEERMAATRILREFLRYAGRPRL